jgi:hypothetical protein
VIAVHTADGAPGQVTRINYEARTRASIADGTVAVMYADAKAARYPDPRVRPVVELSRAVLREPLWRLVVTGDLELQVDEGATPPPPPEVVVSVPESYLQAILDTRQSVDRNITHPARDAAMPRFPDTPPSTLTGRLGARLRRYLNAFGAPGPLGPNTEEIQLGHRLDELARLGESALLPSDPAGTLVGADLIQVPDPGAVLTGDKSVGAQIRTLAMAGSAGTTIGTYASAPVSPSEGALHITTDGPLWRRYNGSAWVDIYPGAGVMTTPPTAGWTYVDAVGTWTAAPGGGLVAIAQGDKAYQTYAAPFKVTAFITNATDVSAPFFGLYETGTDKRIEMYHWDNGSGTFQVTRANAGGAFHSNPYTNILPMTPGIGTWFEVEDDGASIYFRWSPDGHHWFELHSELRNNHFTTGADAAILSLPNTGVVRLWSWAAA